MPPSEAPLELLVLHTGDEPQVPLVPGGRWREWMNATSDRVANRCLPLLVANQAGWVLLNTRPFEARWNGGDRVEDVTVSYDEGDERPRVAASHFGHGILSFGFQCYFRTPPGYNLLARGPANMPKDGIGALEGLVENDFALVPFSMNWKFTRPGSVRFEADEPFCQIVPQRRGELERFRPRAVSIDGDADLAMRLQSWAGARGMMKLVKRAAEQAGDPRWTRFWMHDYFKGRTPTGEENPEHQTQLRLHPLERAESAVFAPGADAGPDRC